MTEDSPHTIKQALLFGMQAGLEILHHTKTRRQAIKELEQIIEEFEL